MSNATELMKLSEIQEQTGFTGKRARNIADWLRDARTEEPEKIDGEIAYKKQFVIDTLTGLLPRIEKRYTEQHEAVKRFITPPPPIKTDWTNAAREFPPSTELFVSEPEETIEPEPEQPAEETNRLRKFLTSRSVMLWGTASVILIFLPFTVLNLREYISISTETVFLDFLVWVLCVLIAICWDFSILIFAVNGKKRMARIGAFILFIFMSAKFDFFKLIFDGIGWDGNTWQLGFVITAIVFYSPALIYQFTELSNMSKDKD